MLININFDVSVLRFQDYPRNRSGSTVAKKCAHHISYEGTVSETRTQSEGKKQTAVFHHAANVQTAMLA